MTRYGTSPRSPAEGRAPHAPFELLRNPRRPDRRRRILLATLGIAAIALGAALNEWTVPWLAGRDPETLRPRSVLGIRCLQALALTAGLASLTFERWSPGFARAGQTAARAVPETDGRLLFALVPFCAVDAMFWALGCLRDEVSLVSVMALLSLADKLLVDGLHLLVVALLVVRFVRLRHAAVVVAVVWGLAIVSETLTYWFGRTRFEAEHLAAAGPESFGAYLAIGPVVFATAALGLCIWTGALLSREATRTGWASIGRAALAVLLLTATDLPRRYHDVARWFRGPLELADAQAHFDRLSYLQSDSVVHMALEIVRPAQRVVPIDDLTPYEDVIERLQLGVGRPAPAPLGALPFRRVVLVVVESLSADFSRLQNPALPETLTPFLDSKFVQEKSLRRHRANAQPTLPGLTVTFLSHPNPDLGREARRPPSFVDVLAQAGWSTVFLRADSRHFGGSHIVLRNVGFEEHLGRDYFLADPELAPYVSEWGVCDRVLLDEAVDLLDERRDERLFLTVLACDTHSPFGRRDYHGLEYPAAPGWIADYPDLAPFLESLFRFDHDLRRFTTELARRGLYDGETLVVVTADHSCPITVELLQLPGARSTPFGQIPLVLLTPRELPPWRRGPTTQLDVGPSLLHLLGHDAPTGMWGASIFDEHRESSTFVGWFRDRLTVALKDQRSFALDAPATPEDRALADLFLRWFED